MGWARPLEWVGGRLGGIGVWLGFEILCGTFETLCGIVESSFTCGIVETLCGTFEDPFGAFDARSFVLKCSLGLHLSFNQVVHSDFDFQAPGS